MLRLTAKLACVAAAALAAGSAGFTAANASVATTLSTIHFSGPATQGSTPGTIVIASSSCSWKPTVGSGFACSLRSNATISQSGIGGKFSIKSLPVRAYGDINGSYTLSPSSPPSPPNTYSMSGTGEEVRFKNGQPLPGFKVSFSGTWTVAPAPPAPPAPPSFNVTGTMTVSR